MLLRSTDMENILDIIESIANEKGLKKEQLFITQAY